MQEISDDVLELKAELWGSFLLFAQTFFPLVTGRDFILPAPPGRESHCLTISKNLTRVARGECNRLVINVPPGHFKSTLVSMWTAWTLSQFPDSQYIYISYAKALAAKHTEFIRRIIRTSHYQCLFGVTLKDDSRAKDSFQTGQGGSIKAFGSSGAITGQDAGLPNLNRFSGALIMDDCHKPDEVHSDAVRRGVIENYRETIVQRPRGENVPMIYIGQRLHEDDLPQFLLSGKDERDWEKCVLQSIDEAGNALCPEINSLESLREKQLKSPYVFASQFQQNPIPAGGALFKDSDFPLLDEEPEILATFITADTAETSKNYNDATAFGFWGVYKLKILNVETEMHGLHCLDVAELRVEPKDLESAFLGFFGECLLHKVKPMFAAIEKKSSGITLCSVLDSMQGLKILPISRTRSSGSKTERFLEMQPYISSKRVSFTRDASHVELCIGHLQKITANDSHRHDDICDNFYDAIKLALIEKNAVILGGLGDARSSDAKAKELASVMRRKSNAKKTIWG